MSSYISFGGKEYTIGDPFTGDLRRLQPAFGFGYGTAIKHLISGVESEIDLLDNPEKLEALLAVLWMAKLRANERDVTADDMRRIPLSDLMQAFKTIRSDDEPPVESDPNQTALTVSDQGDADEAAPAKNTSTSTKTSRKRSTNES